MARLMQEETNEAGALVKDTTQGEAANAADVGPSENGLATSTPMVAEADRQGQRDEGPAMSPIEADEAPEGVLHGVLQGAMDIAFADENDGEAVVAGAANGRRSSLKRTASAVGLDSFGAGESESSKKEAKKSVRFSNQDIFIIPQYLFAHDDSDEDGDQEAQAEENSDSERDTENLMGGDEVKADEVIHDGFQDMNLSDEEDGDSDDVTEA